MDIEMVEAGEDMKSVVLNLGLYYIYDFSETLGFRCPDSGLFGTGCFEQYWSEPDRWPFLVKVDGELAGFVFVGPDGTQAESQYDVGEFFVLRKFRKRGVGQRGWRSTSSTVSGAGGRSGSSCRTRMPSPSGGRWSTGTPRATTVNCPSP